MVKHANHQQQLKDLLASNHYVNVSTCPNYAHTCIVLIRIDRFAFWVAGADIGPFATRQTCAQLVLQCVDMYENSAC